MEDAVAIVSIVLAFFLPIVLIILVTAFLVISILLLPKIIRILRKGLGRMRRAKGDDRVALS